LRYIRRGCDGLFGALRLGGITGDIAVDAGALVDRHEGNGAEVKHVVLSLREENAELLRQVSAAWVNWFAPGRNWLAGIHGNHVHLAVESEGSDGRALDFDKKDTYTMVKMEWTDLVRSAKGTVSSAVERFAQKNAAVVAGLSCFGELQRWAEGQVKNGRLKAARRDRDGRLLSIEMDGERVRLKSVIKAVGDWRSRTKTPDMPDAGGLEVQVAKPQIALPRVEKKAVRVERRVSRESWFTLARKQAMRIARRRKEKGKRYEQ
jgi:hypothetical protein